MTFLQMCKYYERTDLYLTIKAFIDHIKTSQWYKDNVSKKAHSLMGFNSVDISLICTGKYGTTPILFNFYFDPFNDGAAWFSHLYKDYTTELNDYLRFKKGSTSHHHKELGAAVDLQDLAVSAEDNQWLADVFKTLEIVAIYRGDFLRESATVAPYNITYLLYDQLGDIKALKRCGVQIEAGAVDKVDNKLFVFSTSTDFTTMVDSVTDAPDVTLNGKTYQAELIKFYIQR